MDAGNYAKFILALVFVLGLIGLLAVAVRRWGLGLPQTQVRRARDKRLKLIEVMPLDAKRRLVLVRQDATEHLLLLGHNSETVVETGIQPPPDFAAALAETQTEAPETPSQGDAHRETTHGETTP